MKNFYLYVVITLFSYACSEREKALSSLFSIVDSTSTGINFTNKLSFDEKFNVYTYRNFYNGGGVALGDINNDGNIDIYLTANQKQNKLYLNKGNWKFEDITEKAGVGGKMGWSTGVTMADVNGDGWLDIYVCNSGDIEGDKKENELFINNHDGTFSEEGRRYHLNDRGFSTHASFFDYDKDGDLDVYLLNNSYQAIGSFNLERNEREVRDTLGGDKLLRFNGEFFEDVSKEAGIYGSIIGFGLGVTVGDVNKDGWEDIYVSNDFFERDYLYINNQNGTFSEQLTTSMNSISGASMGADMADINNDGYADIFVTEMLPGSYGRLKSVTTFENYDKYKYNVKNGYYHQYTRNTFQLNNGNKSFSEIGRMAGVEATDWSWGALIFDMDNDGYKDLFVANGIYQDLTDQDYLNYISNEEVIKSIVTKNKLDYNKLIEIIPSNPISNKAFKNTGGLQFVDVTKDFGLSTESFSNGAAYGDLDNDGDLDLVVNNVNMPSFIYRNNLMEGDNSHHYLRFALEGDGMNKFGVGSQITVHQGNQAYYLELQPTRGFQSSMDTRPLVGLPKSEPVDIEILWPSQRVTFLKSVTVDQTIALSEAAAEIKDVEIKEAEAEPLLFRRKNLSIRHHENDFVDFNRDRLKYHMSSTEGPKAAVGDVNRDGMDDFYLGGSAGFSGAIIYGSNGSANKIDSLSFAKEKASEDAASTFFDADNDGDLDLYVCTGGSEFPATSTLLKDKLYINDNGRFTLSEQALPVAGEFVATSTVVPFDFDGDGDEDLFVGGRFVPFQYGVPANGYLLQNDGKGHFSEVTSEFAPILIGIGMITDAISIDIDKDSDPDLVVVGEYMGIRVLLNDGNHLTEQPGELSALAGWWSSVASSDVDGDGDLDLVVGNHGLNSRFKASKERPIVLVVDDFDKNGFSDPILSWTDENGHLYPYALRHNLAEQLKFILKKYPDYKSFKDADLEQILGTEMLEKASKLQATVLSSIIVFNDGDGRYHWKELPWEAQLSPIFAIESHDFDDDGDQDIILGGNLYAAKPEVGRYDASYGLYLENQGKGEFKVVPGNRGFVVEGEIRDIITMKRKIIVTRNNDSVIQFDF